MEEDTTVLERFKSAVTFLLDSKIADKKKEIASSCGVSPNYLSGVLYERITLSADLIQKFLQAWPINPAYITCQSDEVRLTNTIGEKSPKVLLNENEGIHVVFLKLMNRLKSEHVSKEERLIICDELNEVFAQLMDKNMTLRVELMENYQKIMSGK